MQVWGLAIGRSGSSPPLDITCQHRCTVSKKKHLSRSALSPASSPKSSTASGSRSFRQSHVSADAVCKLSSLSWFTVVQRVMKNYIPANLDEIKLPQTVFTRISFLAHKKFVLGSPSADGISTLETILRKYPETKKKKNYNAYYS
jgi:hypothetical protein